MAKDQVRTPDRGEVARHRLERVRVGACWNDPTQFDAIAADLLRERGDLYCRCHDLEFRWRRRRVRRRRRAGLAAVTTGRRSGEAYGRGEQNETSYQSWSCEQR